LSKYIAPYVVGFRVNEKGEIIGKIFRGVDTEEKSRDFYHDLKNKGLNCFRAQIREEHGEG